MPFLFYNVARGGDKIKTNVSGIIASIRSFQTEEREDRKEKGKKGREKKKNILVLKRRKEISMVQSHQVA